MTDDWLAILDLWSEELEEAAKQRAADAQRRELLFRKQLREKKAREEAELLEQENAKRRKLDLSEAEVEALLE